MYKSGKRYIFRLIIIFFGVILTIINILNLFLAEKISYACKINFLFNNIILFVLGMGIFVFIYCVIIKIKYKKKSIIIASIGLFLLEIFISYHIAFLPGWDVAQILGNAWKVAMHEKGLSNDYFSYYPNNLLLVGIFSVILRIGKSFAFLIAVQCFLYCLAGYLLFDLILEYTKTVWLAWLGWGIYFILVGTSAWFVVPYSDSMGIIFPALLLWIYRNVRKSEWKISNIVIFSCITFIGYHIKPQTIIVSIAIIVVEIIELLFDFRKRLKKSIISFLIICIIFLAGNSFLNIWIERMGYQINWEMQKGWSHFLMMGLNTESGGIYSVEDNLFSDSFLLKKERKEANLQKVKERVQKLGGGIIIYEMKKALVNFNDGTFLFGIEGGDKFCIKEEPEKDPIITPFLRNIFLRTGNYYNINACIKQGSWISILFFMLGNVFLVLSKKITREQIVLLVSIIGFILFQMLFEARSRYMLVYMVILILCAINGVNEAFTYIRTHRKKL